MGFFAKYVCFCVFLLLCAAGHTQGIAGDNLIFSTDKPDLLSENTSSSDSDVFVIKDIEITGNRRTRNATIFREIPFQINDQLPLNVIVSRFYEAKKQLMNTGLFRNVVVSLKSLKGRDVYVNIEVEEKWYIYPLPFVRLVNDNFHKWWTDDSKRLDYLKYGIKITQYNTTGRNDRLDVYFMNGYTRQLSFDYSGLYLDKKLQWYANMGVQYGKNRELMYKTENNLQVPFTDDNFILNFFHTYASITYRKAIKTRHTFTVGYTQESYRDTILKLNPAYAPHVTNLHYPEFSYTLSYFDLDFNPYPTKGYAAEVSIQKKGFNDPVNYWEFLAKGSATWPLFRHSYFNLKGVGMIKLPLYQPYISQQFLGNNDMFLQGYEYLTIDGTAGGYLKATFARQILNTFIHIPKVRINKNYSLPSGNIPFKLYAKAYVNTGYVYNPLPGNNELPNRMLYSSGIGLDIVTLTDFVIKIEWSFNQLGQNNLYLHKQEYF